MVLPQLAHNLSPSLVFCVNTTKDDAYLTRLKAYLYLTRENPCYVFMARYTCSGQNYLLQDDEHSFKMTRLPVR